MADESNNGSNIVAIFAIIVIAALAVAAFMYMAPRMMAKPPDNGGLNIHVDMPINGAPQPDNGGGQPQQQ